MSTVALRSLLSAWLSCWSCAALRLWASPLRPPTAPSSTMPVVPVSGLDTAKSRPGTLASVRCSTFWAVVSVGETLSTICVSVDEYLLSFSSSCCSMVLLSIALVMSATITRMSETKPITAVISRVWRLIGRRAIPGRFTEGP